MNLSGVMGISWCPVSQGWSSRPRGASWAGFCSYTQLIVFTKLPMCKVGPDYMAGMEVEDMVFIMEKNNERGRREQGGERERGRWSHTVHL